MNIFRVVNISFPPGLVEPAKF